MESVWVVGVLLLLVEFLSHWVGVIVGRSGICRFEVMGNEVMLLLLLLVRNRLHAP